jgi:hypothetical protein
VCADVDAPRKGMLEGRFTAVGAKPSQAANFPANSSCSRRRTGTGSSHPSKRYQRSEKTVGTC